MSRSPGQGGIPTPGASHPSPPPAPHLLYAFQPARSFKKQPESLLQTHHLHMFSGSIELERNKNIKILFVPGSN